MSCHLFKLITLVTLVRIKKWEAHVMIFSCGVRKLPFIILFSLSHAVIRWQVLSQCTFPFSTHLIIIQSATSSLNNITHTLLLYSSRSMLLFLWWTLILRYHSSFLIIMSYILITRAFLSYLEVTSSQFFSHFIGYTLLCWMFIRYKTDITLYHFVSDFICLERHVYFDIIIPSESKGWSTGFIINCDTSTNTFVWVICVFHPSVLIKRSSSSEQRTSSKITCRNSKIQEGLSHILSQWIIT